MDSLSLVLNLFLQFWYVVIFVIVVGFFRTAVGKGILGEFTINLMVKLFLDKKNYHLLKNVTIPVEQGTTQIDHIIISKYGIFVIETKNMKGWIFGGKDQPNWTQKIYKHTNSFQNPLRQNYKHTKALADLISVDHNKIFSLIVFIGDSKFKTPMPDNVTYGRRYIDFIKSKRTPLFGEYDVIELLQRIEERRLEPGFKTHREHVNHVNSLHSQSKSQEGKASAFTKVLVKKIHGGRKQDSKFWQSEYGNINTDSTDYNNQNQPGSSAGSFFLKKILISLALIFVLALTTVYFRPELFHKLPENNFTSLLKHYLPTNNSVKIDIKERSAPLEKRILTENNLKQQNEGYSNVQIKKAVEEVLKNKQNNISQGIDSKQEINENQFLYEIELFSGGWIYTDNAIVEDEKVTYTGGNGLVVSIDKDQVKTMKRIRIDE